VAEARRLAAIPRRPAWRDGDGRWRRRVLAGVWVLVCLPLVDVLKFAGWADRVPVPSVFGFPDAFDTLKNSYLGSMRVDQPLLFCIGVVLLFAKERGRLPGRLDWTRRWGVLCSYVVALLSAVSFLFITALVAVGIGACFMSMPRRNQPAITPWLIDLSAGYLRHVRQPDRADAALIAFSSAAILLACAPLYDALRSTGRRRSAQAILAPLALFALLNLWQAARYWLRLGGVSLQDVSAYSWYFQPSLLPTYAGRLRDLNAWVTLPPPFFAEAIKWCILLAIALWLTAARWLPLRSLKQARSAKAQGTEPATE
jgi:hypothetical protein